MKTKSDVWKTLWLLKAQQWNTHLLPHIAPVTRHLLATVEPPSTAALARVFFYKPAARGAQADECLSARVAPQECREEKLENNNRKAAGNTNSRKL